MQQAVVKVLQKNIAQLLKNNVVEYRYIPQHDKPLPSLPKLQEIVDLLRAIVFPGYYGDVIANSNTLEYHLGVTQERLYALLKEQILYGLCFNASDELCSDAKSASLEKTLLFLDQIPELKRLISTDVKAMYDGDPAAKSYGEVIFCYPAIRAIFNHRIAHALLQLHIPVLPRIISELAHSETGIDIHPGAQIGEYFSIDHGTGVVIGETTVIGNHVTLYQGVTLGAVRFALDEQGKPINLPRHPIVENNVVIYSNANVLGRITIGAGSVIGGNVWLTTSIPPNTKITQQKAVENTFIDGLGI
jgi:serine O-acetyltransferase